ncbi:hypothetical protein SARC_00268 [Sphaeroforma arctica JP610]|uniref:Uncharacterized protein n=1 Tax=Sphaeroforma arctica JP610 TaxID=667725 RepID=A0A0L0GH35_9EUKA|nr:hypothetical protein SARC_00268 [Sphaeroforma arctica JP610]KNC87638.1 hypothetical protein SARC_00268 [Sphaeroforma arctica JP610]|eukprot:XP_014161540.1 hypothetical protein SARC_00268 [Sphaeroforma arctica JP610]
MTACDCISQDVCDECTCNCKRGRCSVCNSACKKCKCACNGTNGARKRGRQKGFTKVVGKVQRTSSGHTSAKRACLDIAESIRALDTPSRAKSAPSETYTLSESQNFVTISTNSNERLNTIEISRTFGWSRNSRRALPSTELCTNNTEIQRTHPNGWSCMSQIVLKAATRVANIVYPADADALLRNIASSLGAASNPSEDVNKLPGGRVLN